MRTPPITERMTHGGVGTGSYVFKGARVLLVVEVCDSDRDEQLFVIGRVRENELRVVMVSCDPGYEDDDATRTPDRWEVCFYDVTDTPAGIELLKCVKR